MISPNVFADMIEQLLNSEVLGDNAKKEAMRIVRSAAFMNGVASDVEQVERVRLAQKLLAEGLGAPLIKKRLMSAFQVSYRTSCRDVTKARDLCHLRGTETSFNESNEEGGQECTQSFMG